MTLILQRPTGSKITLRQTWQPMDPDAAAYITAVETADGQALEEKVKIAIDNFVLGCKSDGIWDAIKASCILAGARTLSGALVPLKGTAPTSFGFVAADYNRETGLKGNGSTKYLDSNRTESADPLLNQHISTYATVAATGNGCYIGARDASNIGSQIVVDTTKVYFISRNVVVDNSGPVPLAGFSGLRRSASVASYRRNGATLNGVFGTPVTSTGSYFVFNRPSSASYSNARLSFYSIGESLDLALLDSRLTTLMSDIGAAIP